MPRIQKPQMMFRRGSAKVFSIMEEHDPLQNTVINRSHLYLPVGNHLSEVSCVYLQRSCFLQYVLSVFLSSITCEMYTKKQDFFFWLFLYFIS